MPRPHIDTRTTLQLTDEFGDTVIHTFSPSLRLLIVANKSKRPAALSERQAHTLHKWLGDQLGLTHPRPTSPLTASKAATQDRPGDRLIGTHGRLTSLPGDGHEDVT